MRIALAAILLAWPAFAEAQAPAHPLVTQGPYLHFVDHEWVYIWARFSEPDKYLIVATKEGDKEPSRALMTRPVIENDNCSFWAIAQPEPDTTYRYQIMRGAEVLLAGPEYSFHTPPARDTPQIVKLVFSARASADSLKGIGKADGIILLGASQALEAPSLEARRSGYRALFSSKELTPVLRATPLYAIWGSGEFDRAAKEDSRKAFAEYRALHRMGNRTQGIYYSFRRGPVEVFMLDTETFRDAEPSMWQADKLAVLGGVQWQWLSKALSASSAPFKLICSGMEWNDLVPPEKKDCWARYPHERENLFRIIGMNKLAGVTLAGTGGGAARIVQLDTKDKASYDIVELVATSSSTEAKADKRAEGAGLLFSADEGPSLLSATADTVAVPPSLTLEATTAEGKCVFSHVIPQGGGQG